MKKIFTNETLFIENDAHLEEVKDLFFKNNTTTLWGYDYTYANDKVVSSGYLHYDRMFYLSKENFDKPVITFDELKSRL